MIVTETARLVLRHFEPEDAPFALALLNEPSFLENIGDKKVRTLEDASRYLADGPIASYARNGHGLYVVARRGNPEPMGMCGLLKRENRAEVDLGYAFLPPFWGQGYAYESAVAVLGRAGSVHGLSRVVAFVSRGNERSIRLLEKLGFVAAGETTMASGEPAVRVFEKVDLVPRG
jgi:RimJ/RimL family protein N-acetyltransferase